MRVGIFGGSFDPIHYGHLLLAESCREAAQLDQIVFIPTAVQPHKPAARPASGEQRLAMIELAIAGNPAFQASRLELDRGGVSYTVETLAAWRSLHPGDELFLLLGADALADLPTWKDPQQIIALATLLVVGRGDDSLDFSVLAPFANAEQQANFEKQQVTMPPVGLSSSEIRQRLAKGESIRYRTPRAVECYLREHRLYL